MIKNVRKIVKRVGVVLVLGFAMATVSAIPVLGGFAVSEADAVSSSDTGMPLYTWGLATNGMLGRPSTIEHPANLPARLGTDLWISTASASGGAYGVNAAGELFAWGNGNNNHNMGQGESVFTGTLDVPTRVGTADNWVQVTGRSNNVAALNDQGQIYRWGNAISGIVTGQNVPVRLGTANNWTQVIAGNSSVYAINEHGHLYSWGAGTNGQLGLGDTAGRTSLTRVGDRSDWAHITTGAVSVVGLTEGGEIFSWGNGADGRLGQGDNNDRNVPTQIGTASNWIDVRTTNTTGAAVNSNGEVFSWGEAISALGRTPDALAPSNLPGIISVPQRFVSLMGANSHYLGFSDDGRLYGWGNNGSGQLGLGDSVSRATPTLVVEVSRFSTAARGGGMHSMMLIDTTPATGEEGLAKRLQKPVGTPVPNLNFTFTVTRNSFNDDTAQANVLPLIGTATSNPNVGNIVIPINASSGTNTDAGIVTLTNSRDILAGVEFANEGVFSYIVRETVNSSGTNAAANLSSVVYSQAEYELRIYTSRVVLPIGEELQITGIAIWQRIDDQGTTINPPVKVDDFTFTNIYTRTTTGTTQHPGGLSISKTIVGDFVDLIDTSFNFDVTLTRTALCPTNTTFTGRILNQAGTQIGSPITFTSGTAVSVELGHNQRLVFDELVVGTTFSVTELATSEFIPSVVLHVGGTAVDVDPVSGVGLPLSTGNHLIGVGRNTADFTNTHFFTPPTGFAIDNQTFLLIPTAAAILIALLTLKARRRVEEPFVFNARKKVEDIITL